MFIVTARYVTYNYAKTHGLSDSKIINDARDYAEFDEAYYRARCRIERVSIISVDDAIFSNLAARDQVDLVDSNLKNCFLGPKTLCVNSRGDVLRPITMPTRVEDATNEYLIYLANPRLLESTFGRVGQTSTPPSCFEQTPQPTAPQLYVLK